MKRTRHRQAKRLEPGRASEEGFALLEILIAFLVLALGVGALAVGVAVALRSDARTSASRTAMRLAQSRLEMAGVTAPLLPGRREGQMGDKYRWQETITEVRLGRPQISEPRPKPTDGGQDGLRPFWVEVTVRNVDGSGARIAALKLGAGQAK